MVVSTCLNNFSFQAGVAVNGILYKYTIGKGSQKLNKIKFISRH